jgi:DNA-3-methyladenine glycosylase II
MHSIRGLDLPMLREAVAYLAASDPDLARLHAASGYPPFWKRPAGFPTLVHIILEQQVSLASAQAAFDRLGEALGTISPASFLTLDDVELKRIGFSRQKAGYCRGLAGQILEREVDLTSLRYLDDEAARAALLRIKGIGPWTADIYLLMALRRPDIWPVGDLALEIAVQEVKGLEVRPDAEKMQRIAAAWRPWRAVAARLFWQYYLSSRQASGGQGDG